MTADRWRRVRAIFDAVADLEPAARERALDTHCAGDPDLRRDVAALLACDRPADDTLDRIVGLAAAEAAEAAVAADMADATGMVWNDTAFPPTIGRYRLLDRLGEGGMGVVFLAEDTSLGRRVALKLPLGHLANDPDARQRLQREARAAATLNHPHVCVVHEVGDGPDERPFIAMELIDGETLAARIARGPMNIADVLTLGRQAASALDAAHALGVVHRDLKPSNIMFGGHGIKLLDFGLASVTRDAMRAGPAAPSGFMGTVPYMSPEQVRGDALDQRTDLFSLGVVLYEAATGRLPFEGATRRETCAAILAREPTPPSHLNPLVPPALERVILRALAKPRDARYQTAAMLGADLSAIDRRAAVRVGATWRWLAAALAAMVLTGAAAYHLRGGAARPSAPPPADVAILLAEFRNTTGEAAFDGTLRQALAVQLQQSPVLRLFPRAGIQETLRQMTRPAETRLSPDIAREIARRRGIGAVIDGSIAAVAGGYEVSLVATRGDTGAEIAREQARATTRGDVLRALDTAAARLRERLGESTQSIGQFNAPIQRTATASLDALKAYTLGTQQSERGDYAVAVALFERAVQIDPEFAMGYQALAREQSNGVYPQHAVNVSSTRAYQLRARATDQERFSIETSYHALVAHALDRAVASGERWKAAYPHEFRPYHALADLYFSLGHHERAAENGREATRLNPDVAAAYSNLGASLFVLGRFAEARDVYRQAMARGLDAPEYHAFLWRIAYYTGDEDDMQRQIAWAAASSSWAYNMPALIAGLEGRWAAARTAVHDASAFFARREMPGLVVMAARYQAMTGALVGDCVTARRSAARVLASDQVAGEQSRAVLALALCGDTAQPAAYLERMRRRMGDDTIATHVLLPTIRAAVDLRQGRAAAAIEGLKVTTPYESAAESWPIYLRALALLQAGAAAEARAEFEKIAGRPSRALWFPLGPLSRLGMARARTLAGDRVGARLEYETLFATWKDADQDLPVLIDARAEYERLR